MALENMDSDVFSPLLEQFMLTPLVCWVRATPPLPTTTTLSPHPDPN